MVGKKNPLIYYYVLVNVESTTPSLFFVVTISDCLMILARDSARQFRSLNAWTSCWILYSSYKSHSPTPQFFTDVYRYDVSACGGSNKMFRRIFLSIEQGLSLNIFATASLRSWMAILLISLVRNAIVSLGNKKLQFVIDFLYWTLQSSQYIVLWCKQHQLLILDCKMLVQAHQIIHYLTSHNFVWGLSAFVFFLQEVMKLTR